MEKSSIHVSIALLFHQTQVLVGWRTAQQHQGNKYEFPGGKIEQGESPEQACTREVFEEVGVNIQTWHPFDVIHHEYEDIHVYLHLFHAKVSKHDLPNIQAPWTWYRREQLLDLNFPQANREIIQRLYWQKAIKISDNLEDIYQTSNEILFYWRPEHADQASFNLLRQLDTEYLQRLIINWQFWQQLDPTKQKYVILHFKQHQLESARIAEQTQTDRIPVGVRCIASCHDQISLELAEQSGCDAVLLSPVCKTLSHPETESLGWDKFAQLAETLSIPVFALGGLAPTDDAIAQQHHAYGIAGIRNF